MPRLHRFDWFALLLSLVGVLAAWLVSEHVFERVPHLEDEIAYVWQAQALAEGHLSLPSPPYPQSFLVPFVVDYEGQRFGKYPLGWPLVLAAGVKLGLRGLVNPLLAGLAALLTYLLGKRILGAPCGLLAAALTLTSPFFLLNSGSLLSHPLGLVLTTGFVLAWLGAFGDREAPRRWLPTLAAALLLGGLMLTRPFTAAAVAVPFGVHGLYLLVRGGPTPAAAWQTRLHLVVFGILALGLGMLHFAWQYAVTGDPFLNPYTLWWSYDTVGFGPGHGFNPAGHTLRQAWINSKHSLRTGWRDLFGWGSYSWLLLPVGVLAARRNYRALLVGSLYPILVVAYLAYWVSSWLYGPRYYYEGLISLTLLTAAGAAWLAGWPLKQPDPAPNDLLSIFLDRLKAGFRARMDQAPNPRLFRLNRLRPWLVASGLVLLAAYNLAFTLPTRLAEMNDLYTISRSDLDPFLTPEAQALTPALIVVHPQRWMPYGALLELQNVDLTSPFIFIYTRGPQIDAEVARQFPERQVFHYYPHDPWQFYKEPLNE